MQYNLAKSVTEKLPRTVPLDAAHLQKFIDERIGYWRWVSDRAGRGTRQYLIARIRAGAYQDLRASLLGERLMEEQNQQEMRFEHGY